MQRAALALASALALVQGSRASAQPLGDVRLPTVEIREDAPLAEGGLGRSGLQLDAARLQASGAEVGSELSSILPGLTAIQSTPRQTSLFVRGQGSTSLNDGLDSSVGLYVDGHYLARPAYAALGLFDLEEVSLLRGASDAKTGPGSIAGELRLSTAPPTPTPGGEFSVSAGSLGYVRTTAAFNGPIKVQRGSLSGRLSVDRQTREGLLFNQFDGQQINGQDRLGLRGQLLWKPRGDFQLRLSADYGVQDQDCCTFPLIGPGSQAVQASDAYMGYVRPGGNPADRVVDTDTVSRGRQTQQGLSATAEWQLDSIHRLVSLTGLRSLRYTDNLNGDASSLRLLDGSLPTRSWQVTQETRWHRDTAASSQVLGLFLMREDTTGEEGAVLGDEIFPWTFGGLLRQQVPGLTRQNSGLLLETLVPPATFNGLRLSTPYSQTSDTASAFGSSTWRLGSRNQLGAGLRLTGVSRQASISRSRSGGNLSASPLSLTNSLEPLAPLLGMGLGSLTFNGLVDSLVGESFSRTDRRQDLGGSGRLAYERAIGIQPEDPLRLQVSLTRGYKAGGLNLAGLGGIARPQFDPETSTGLELGLKGETLANRLRYGLTAYRTEVRDYQALSYNTGEGLVSTPRQNNILNIPKVRLTGLELDAGLKLPFRLQIDGAIAYSRAISTEFPNAPNPDTQRSDRDLSGRQLYNAPLWSGRLELSQVVPLPGPSLEAYWGVQQSFRSSYFLSVEQTATTRVPSYGLTDLRVGLQDPGQSWQVEAWIRNLTDEDALQSVVALYGLGDYGGVAIEPRMVGATVRLRY